MIKAKDWLDYICTIWDVYEFEAGTGRHQIDTFEYLGMMTYYPKRNKVHIHKFNRWISNGANWMIRKCIIIESEFSPI